MSIQTVVIERTLRIFAVAGRLPSALLGRSRDHSPIEQLETRVMMSGEHSHLFELSWIQPAVEVAPAPDSPDGLAVSSMFPSGKTTAPVQVKAGPLQTPGTPAATLSGSRVALTWADADGSGVGYIVQRASGNGAFKAIATLKAGSDRKFTDSGVSANQTYRYRVVAVSGARTSQPSNAASVAVPPPGGNVTVQTRYGSEVVVTSLGADTISVTQSGSNVTILADGHTYTRTAGTGLFIYDRAGNDTITVDASVRVRTTITSLGGGLDHITSSDSSVSVWIDGSDVFKGAGVVHRVTGLAGGVSMATGAALADPSDAGRTVKVEASLWGSGPSSADVNQGGMGDCYFLASLAAFAQEKPSVLTDSAVDMGDGTYVVRFFKGSQAVYVRVSNDLSTGPYGGYEYAHPGSSATIWAPIMEKAFAYFRSGANSYNSVDGGWMGEVYSDLGVRSSNFWLTSTEQSFYRMVSSALAHGLAVTLGTYGMAPDLLGSHAYTLVSASVDQAGVTSYTVRNPWGASGDALEDSRGYATLSYGQLKANFVAGAQATA